MALVARRRMNQTWREAALEIGTAADREEAVRDAFERRLAEGLPEHIAAYRALEDAGCLVRVDLPGDPARSLAEAEEEQIEPDADDSAPRSR